jgi:hypothetical protein
MGRVNGIVFAVALCSAAVGAGGCRAWRQRRIIAQVDAAARAVPLAHSDRKLPSLPPGPRARILVERQKISFDSAGAVSAYPPATLAGLVAALKATRSGVEIRIHREASYGLVTRVLETVAASDLEALAVVETGSGDGVLELVQDAAGERPCPTARLQIGARGVGVAIAPSTGAILHAESGGEWRRPAWQRSIVAASSGSCPAVPRRAGALDPPALIAFVREVAAALPLCEAEVLELSPTRPKLRFRLERKNHSEIVLISAESETPWREVVATADAAVAAGFMHARLRGVTSEDQDDDCRDAIPAPALGASFAGE